jgi:hypothetical protein
MRLHALQAVSLDAHTVPDALCIVMLPGQDPSYPALTHNQLPWHSNKPAHLSPLDYLQSAVRPHNTASLTSSGTSPASAPRQ